MDIYQLKDQLHFEKVEGGMIGEVDDYYFSLFEGKVGPIRGVFLGFTFNNTVTNATLRTIRKHSKMPFILQTAVRKNDTAYVVVPRKIKDTNKYMTNLLKLTAAFQMVPLRQAKSCFVCGKPDFEEKAEITVRNGYALKHHLSCVEKYNNHLDQEEAISQNAKKMPVSILLTIIGAVIGLIPNLIALYGFEMMFGYGYALIPLAAFYGFKFGGAPINKRSTVIIVATSIVASLAMVLLYIATICSWTGLSMSEIFADDVIAGGLISDLLFMVVFTILGIVISWRLITNANRPKHL